MSQAQAIELSPAELELIEARRTEAAAKVETKRLEEEARAAKAQRQADAHALQVATMVTALRKVDTNGILFQAEENGTVKFILDGREEEVEIVNHKVYHGSSWSGSNRGLKFRLRGGYNNYNERYYTNPKTVIKKIVEFQEIVQTRSDIAKSKASNSDIALKFMTEKYPSATVTFEPGYDYRGNRRYNSRDYKPDTIKVETENGSYEFSYTINDGKIASSVWKRTIGKNIQDEVRTLILG